MKNKNISFYASIAIEIHKSNNLDLTIPYSSLDSILAIRDTWVVYESPYMATLKQIFKSKILVFGWERLDYRLTEWNKLINLRKHSEYSYKRYAKSLFVGDKK